ncbi:MFS transporter [Mycolicibacterium brisbanense]|uniref:Arabinose efflux permease family protein n=1 Tax=Mycolicibacterium brisbanense TaxID=146020 RepID=A0A100VWC1_9MYCO|nr:MFS transporter [Mycolicibacterium brisbanense]GAS87111.1 arabinose efflux permease family protein [Mycolicibacterium brisbanense]
MLDVWGARRKLTAVTDHRAATAPRHRWILAAVSTALLCVQLDYFAVNLALPKMAEDLGTTATDLQWVISIYMLALGACMVPAGRIGDIFGRRRILLIGIAVFGASSAVCAVAPSAAWVIGSRAAQGVGAALIFPVSVSVLTNAFPVGRAARAIGLAYGIGGLGNAAGPLVGGLLTQTVGWRAIFWLLVPLALVSAVIGGITMPESSDHTVPRRVDLSGLALITIGIGLFTLTFDRGPSWGWLSLPTVAAFVISMIAMAAFVVTERRVKWPLVDLSLLRDQRFTMLIVTGTVANIAYVVAIYLSTLNLQEVRGLDPLTAGLAFLGPSAGAAAGGVFSGRLATKYPPMVVMGTTGAAAAISLAVLALSHSWPLYLIALTACGFTMGLVYAFTTVATQAVVPPEQAGAAAGVALTSMVTLGGVGIAVTGTVLEMLEHAGSPASSGTSAILLTIAILLLPSSLLVLGRAKRTNR